MNTFSIFCSALYSQSQFLRRTSRDAQSGFIVQALRLVILLSVGLLPLLSSCTSTIGQQAKQQELSNNTEVLLFTLSRARNAFLVDDVNFSIDDTNRLIILTLQPSQLKSDAAINAKTRFQVDIAIPAGASIVINGQIIRDENVLSLLLAKGFFTGRELPMIVIAEDQKTQSRYTITTSFTRPTFSFRYNKNAYLVKSEQERVNIKKPRIRGTARGSTAFKLSPQDAYVSLNTDGALILTPDAALTETLTRTYIIRARRQGIRFARRLKITFYPNHSPSASTLLSPSNYQRDVNRTAGLQLAWTPSTDVDEDVLTYNVLVSSNVNLLSESGLSTLYQQSATAVDLTINVQTQNLSYVIDKQKLAPDTLYYWKVIASDGFISRSSEIFRFTTITNNIPEIFTTQLPSAKAAINLNKTTTMNFNWTASADADEDKISYMFYLSSDINALRKALRVSIIAANKIINKTKILEIVKLQGTRHTLRHTLFAPSTTYYWTVKATDGFSERIINIEEFTTVSSSPVIDVIAPLVNSTRINGGIPFPLSWQAPAELTASAVQLQYTVYFSDSEQQVAREARAVRSTNNLSTNQLTISNKLASKTTYYWKVKGTFSPPKEATETTAAQTFAALHGVVVSSPLASFTTTNHAPSRPSLNYPTQQAQNIPRINGLLLSWNASTDLDRDDLNYNIYLSPYEEDLVLSDQNVRIATEVSELDYIIPPENLAPLTTYYWKISASDGNAETSSPIYQFSTSKNLPPKIPALLQPLASNAETHTLNTEIQYGEGIHFIWALPSYIEGDELYRVLIDTNPQNLTEAAASIQSDETNRYRYTLRSASILPKTQYYWRLLVKDRYGEEVLSDIEAFRTRGFRLRLNRKVVTAENPKDFAFSISLPGGKLKGRNFTYRYALSAAINPNHQLKANGILVDSKTTQSLNISTLGSGALKLSVTISDAHTKQDIETLTATARQAPFIKVTSVDILSKIGDSPQYPSSSTYTLMQSLDLKNSFFQPIGNDREPFTGVFYGQNYTISNLTVSRKNKESSGFFGVIRNGRINALTIITSDAGISGGNFTGGLSGKITGSSLISNIYFNGKVTGKDQVGALAGRINGRTTVVAVTTRGRVRGSDNIGGIGGRVYSGVSISNAHSLTRVQGTNDVGGIIGRGIDVTIRDCSSLNTIEGRTDVGGIAGSLIQSQLSHSSSRSKLVGTSKVGGIVGWLSESDIINSFSIGELSGLTDVGGIVGYMLSESMVSNTYSESRIRGRNNVGGIAGLITGKSTIKNSYVRGSIIPNIGQTGDTDVAFGGIAGGVTGINTLTNNYYSFISIEPIKSASLVLTEEQTTRSTAANKGITAPSLKQTSTFRNWDFNNIWDINIEINNGFPFLKENVPNAPN